MFFVINVDFQGDFVFKGWALPVDGAEDLIIPMKNYLYNLDPAKCAGVLNTFDTHTPEQYNGSEEQKSFPNIHCELGTPGWESVVDLDEIAKTEVPTYTLKKGVFNMWEEETSFVCKYNYHAVPAIDMPTPRDEFFANLKKQGVREIVVVGVAADFCVKQAIDGLLARGFHVTVLKHLTKGIFKDISQVASSEEYAYNSDLVVA